MTGMLCRCAASQPAVTKLSEKAISEAALPRRAREYQGEALYQKYAAQPARLRAVRRPACLPLTARRARPDAQRCPGLVSGLWLGRQDVGGQRG